MSAIEPTDSKWVIMGQIAGAYGIKGQIRVHNYDDVPVDLIGISPWFLKVGNQFRPYNVRSAKVHQQSLVAFLERIQDRDQAAALRGIEVAVRAFDLPEVDDETFYWHELVGMVVVNREGISLGCVMKLIHSPANEVLQIEDEQGTERLIPMVGQAIDEIDRENRIIRVDWQPDWL